MSPEQPSGSGTTSAAILAYLYPGADAAPGVHVAVPSVRVPAPAAPADRPERAGIGSGGRTVTGVALQPVETISHPEPEADARVSVPGRPGPGPGRRGAAEASRRTGGRRRPSVEITLGRAARLRRFVSLLAQKPRTRDEVLRELGIGLRTFYRELDFVKRLGIRVGRKDRAYSLQTTTEKAEGLLPFPDPQLSFAEVAELARHPGEAARRLAGLLARVSNHPGAKARGANQPGRSKAAQPSK
jgi:hypothetical protein